MELKAFNIKVYGRVQSVGFRRYALDKTAFVSEKVNKVYFVITLSQESIYSPTKRDSSLKIHFLCFASLSFSTTCNQEMSESSSYSTTYSLSSIPKEYDV